MPAPLRIPHAPLSDAEWQAILPHLRHDPTRGRPCDRRAQFDAIFRVAATDGPWHELPEQYGKPDTVSRYFRRLAHAGFWEHLLLALAASPKGHPFRRLEGLICRAARRAIRIRGLRIIVLARRLRLYRALPAPPCLVPDPDLSEFVRGLPLPTKIPATRRMQAVAIDYIRTLKKLMIAARGRRRIPGIYKRIWI
jgi:transposase